MSVDFLDLATLGLAVVAFQTAALVVWAVVEGARTLSRGRKARVPLLS